MQKTRFLHLVSIGAVLFGAAMSQPKALANNLSQIQYFCASRSANAYQLNYCVNILYKRLQQSQGGGYWDPKRKDFHPCDNPLVPTSIC